MTRLRTLEAQDRLPLAAGAVMLWVAVGPWLWGFAGSRPAVANHVFVVFAFGPLALLIASLRPAAFVTLAGGVWLALSPWALGYATTDAAWANELISGVLLIAVCARTARAPIPMRRRRRRSPKRAAAARIAIERIPSGS
jgi:SPW repeat